jgi:hypothetical protein
MKIGMNDMRIVRPVFTGMALVIAGIMTFDMADTALAKTKEHEETSTAQSQPQVQPRICIAGPIASCKLGSINATSQSKDSKQVDASAHEFVSRLGFGVTPTAFKRLATGSERATRRDVDTLDHGA